MDYLKTLNLKYVQLNKNSYYGRYISRITVKQTVHEYEEIYRPRLQSLKRYCTQHQWLKSSLQEPRCALCQQRILLVGHSHIPWSHCWMAGPRECSQLMRSLVLFRLSPVLTGHCYNIYKYYCSEF